MGRPRTISDEDIFAATQRAMTRLGPLNLTLADVAKETGISAATLVQRFKSKRGLLLAVSKAASAGGMDACFDVLRETTPSPLEQLMTAAMFMAQAVETPDQLANHLGFFLQVDLSDPDFYPHTLEMSRQMDAAYVRLANEAVAAGELIPCDTAALARAIGALAAGSLIGWAVYRDGKAEDWVRRDIETLVAPYRKHVSTSARRTSARSTSARSTSHVARGTSERGANRPQVRKQRRANRRS